MDRRSFIKQSSIAGAGLFVPIPHPEASQTVRLTVLHTNDMHSRIEPFPNDGRRNAGHGGMARRATIIKKIRSEQEHVLLLDAGDIFQGTPYFNFFGGELEFKLMSRMGYDAATIGNHDFDNGIDGIANMLPHAEFPFLSSNYDFSRNQLKGRFAPYKIFKKGRLRIGVFGLGIELKGLVNANLYKGTKYIDPIATAKEMVQTLEAKDCDLILCLSHLGYKYDNDKISDHTLAEKVNGIDLIIGGHTHTFLDDPVSYTNKNGHTTLINQVGWAGIKMGRIDYVFSKKNKQVKSKNAITIS